MKRSGRPSWTWTVPASRLEAIKLAIETGRETPREMFTRLDVQRFTCFQTFRRYVTEQRRVNRGRESSPISVNLIS